MPLTPPARAFHPLQLAAIRPETAEAVTLTFHVPPALTETFRFRPGQYLTLRTRLPDGTDVRRSYSICSGPGEPLRVAVKRVPGGLFSAWAPTATPGQPIDAMPPQGRFVLPPAGTPRHVLLVAAGSGITPLLAIAKATLRFEPGTALTLLYGSRSTPTILFREELEALKDRHLSRLSVHHVLSREAQDIPILHGRLHGSRVLALLRGRLPHHALLCGPPALVDDVSAALQAAGLPSTHILSERFTPAGTPARPPAPIAEQAQPQALATIIADGTTTEVPMEASETVLDAALRAGLDLPYSCRAGMCSTCRARVVAGTATMDINYGLEPWETAAGYTLTCQARPTTSRLTVDYDAV